MKKRATIVDQHTILKNSLLALAGMGFLLMGLKVTAQAQSMAPLEVHAALDTQQIRIGEQFHLILQAITDSTTGGVQWAAVPDSFNHLMVVDRSKVDTIAHGKRVIYQQRYTLTGFDSGRWYVPTFVFHGIRAAGTDSAQGYQTDSLPIFVHTVAVDTTKPFQPIKEIRTVPFNLWDYWPYLLAGLVIVLIVLFFVFVYKRKKRPEKIKTEPEIPPYEQAVKGLQSLEAEKLWQQGAIKEYYSRLTDILRLYIQRQYQVNALEQTTDELMEKIKPVTQLNQQRNNLETILQTADLAKFAKLQPTPEEHESCMHKAKEIVEWTKPQPAAEAPKPDKKTIPKDKK